MEFMNELSGEVILRLCEHLDNCSLENYSLVNHQIGDLARSFLKNRRCRIFLAHPAYDMPFHGINLSKADTVPGVIQQLRLYLHRDWPLDPRKPEEKRLTKALVPSQGMDHKIDQMACLARSVKSLSLESQRWDCRLQFRKLANAPADLLNFNPNEDLLPLGFDEMFAAASNLVTLRISSGHEIPAASPFNQNYLYLDFFDHYLTRITLPSLVHLTLQNFNPRPGQTETFARNHCKTLKTLRLENIRPAARGVSAIDIARIARETRMDEFEYKCFTPLYPEDIAGAFGSDPLSFQVTCEVVLHKDLKWRTGLGSYRAPQITIVWRRHLRLIERGRLLKG